MLGGGTPPQGPELAAPSCSPVRHNRPAGGRDQRAPYTILADRRIRLLASALLVFAGYYLGAKAGTYFVGSSAQAAVIWPPNCIVLTALLLSPPRQWWAYALAAAAAEYAFDLPTDVPFVQSTGFAAADLLEVFAAALLVRWLIPGRIDIARPRHALILTASAALVGSVLSAFVGAAALSMAGPIEYWAQWRQWWLGDALSHVTVTPFLLSALSAGLPWVRSMTRRHLLGILGAITLTSAAIAYLALSHHTAAKPLTLAEVFLVVSIAAAVSTLVGVLETSATVLVIAAACGLLTISDIGPFAGLPQEQSILNMQAFLLLLGTTALFVAGTVTQRNRLKVRLEEMTITDELTGAFNRRYLLVQATLEVERAKRFKRPLAFLFLDLDHFKQVNDRFGHQIGDLVLSTFSDMCRKALRPSDTLVRYGGEEFVVILPETGLDAAVSVAGRIRQQWQETAVSTNPQVRGLTVSIGVSALRGDDDNLDPILERIDKAMYRAKELGRDRVEVAP